MVLIEFKNLPDTSTPLSAENLNEMQSNIENAIKGTELYSNDAGSNESITLSETSANFDYIEIEYKCNTYGYKTTRLYNPNGKNIVLDYTTAANNTVVQTASSNYLISGVNITLQSSCMINTQTNGSIIAEIGNKLIKITRVVGYK